MTQKLLSRKALAPVLAATAMAVAGLASAASLTEGFDVVGATGPAGWSVVNASVPTGTASWFQGNSAVFPAFAGAPTSYIGANFNSTAGTGAINNFLITPNLTFNNGDVVRFYTRTTDLPTYPDRLELRFSSGSSFTAPTGGTGVGSFSSLLLSVNAGLTVTGYPNVWTQYTATISGLSGATAGNLAFRYFVPSGGPTGSNSDYIGIDSFSITAAIPEPGTYGLMGLGIAGVLLAARRRKAA